MREEFPESYGVSRSGTISKKTYAIKWNALGEKRGRAGKMSCVCRRSLEDNRRVNFLVATVRPLLF